MKRACKVQVSVHDDMSYQVVTDTARRQVWHKYGCMYG